LLKLFDYNIYQIDIFFYIQLRAEEKRINLSLLIVINDQIK